MSGTVGGAAAKRMYLTTTRVTSSRFRAFRKASRPGHPGRGSITLDDASGNSPRRSLDPYVRGVAPVESLWTLPGRRSRKGLSQGDYIAGEPLVRRHTGRLPSEPTCATSRSAELEAQTADLRNNLSNRFAAVGDRDRASGAFGDGRVWVDAH